MTDYDKCFICSVSSFEEAPYEGTWEADDTDLCIEPVKMFICLTCIRGLEGPDDA